jgi:hypothetical protein
LDEFSAQGNGESFHGSFVEHGLALFPHGGLITLPR